MVLRGGYRNLFSGRAVALHMIAGLHGVGVHEDRAAAGLATTGSRPSFQAVSAGRIRVAIWPGAALAASIAKAPSAAMS